MNTKPKTVILDSSVWIAYFRTQDAHHLRALAVIDKFQDHLFLIPEIVYYETIIRYFTLYPSITSVKSLIFSLKSSAKVKFCNLNIVELEYLILKYLMLIQLKSSDFQILIYVIKFTPDAFITFDKRLRREYNKLANKNELL
jgi:predicted nucleic acid-binding protein